MFDINKKKNQNFAFIGTCSLVLWSNFSQRVEVIYVYCSRNTKVLISDRKSEKSENIIKILKTLQLSVKIDLT